MKFILGTKLGMTQVFREDGAVVPVTRVSVGPCVITQVKTKEKDGFNAVQVGFGKQKLFRLHKAKQGHLKGLPPLRFLREIRLGDDEKHEFKRGDEFTLKVFEPGDKVQVIGKSKGKGFQGVVKRHGFHGSPASHGHKDQLRMPGSIGATDAARVFKGTRMAGHMGDASVTIKNLEIVEVRAEENELLIKGAVPGARGGIIIVSSEEGKMEISQPEEVVKEENTKKEEKNKESKSEVEKVPEETKEKEVVEEVKKEKKEKTEEPKVEEKKEETEVKEKDNK